MSCAFLSCGEWCPGSGGEEISPLACPHSSLVDGLHAMAQPLTILRGVFGARKMRDLTAAENDRYMEMSEKQVARMGDLLGCLQDLLDITEGEPKSGRIDLGELFSLVLEDMASTLQDWGGKIYGLELNHGFQILGDADRTERALRAALRAAISVSSSKGALRVSIRPCGDGVEFALESSVKRGKPVSIAERMNFSLVNTNVCSQGGTFKCIEDPLSITITLPAYGSEAGERAPILKIVDAHLPG